MKFSNSTKVKMNALGFAFCLMFFSLPVLGCDCVGPSGRQAITPSSAAFRGTVTDIEYLDVKTGTAEPRTRVTFKVARVWNGTVKKSFVLHTTENSWTCAGYHFIKGKEYLVVAYPNDEETAKRFPGVKNSFGTNPCGATLPIELAKMQLIELGSGKKPKK